VEDFFAIEKERHVRIKPGDKVVDRNGQVLGSVDLLARNTWTGEITKFIVTRKPPAKDLFLTPEDILEGTESNIRLKGAGDEYSGKP
jgi:hypothetical protein